MVESQLIFQRNDSILVTPGINRDQLASVVRWCAQLRGIVAGNYVYDISKIALWGAAARGITAERIISALEAKAAMSVPATVQIQIAKFIGRYGAIQLTPSGSGLKFEVINAAAPVNEILSEAGLGSGREIQVQHVAKLKVAAAAAGWPIVDSRQIADGNKLDLRLASTLQLRPYQRAAVSQFVELGNGLILLPCGAGKTVVGIATSASIGRQTLVMVPSRSVGHQWERAFESMTDIDAADVGLVTRSDSPMPVSICTYHGATASALAGNLIDHPWGLIIYDEVQSLPASTFRLAAEFQSTRRLGLTATLVREDHREGEIFALVGPPVFDTPWIELERDGWIAPATCTEIRLPTPAETSDINRYKIAVLKRLLMRHQNEKVLVVSSNLELLSQAAKTLHLESITGETPQQRRQLLFEAFNYSTSSVLALSKVGSVGLDLPGASVMIQLTGTYGSRQEEAQRLGRILRPGVEKQAHFYTLVTNGTREVHFAQRRQRYLVVQGYEYKVVDAADIPRDV